MAYMYVVRAPIGNKHWHAGPDADPEAYRVKAEAMQGLHVSLWLVA